MSLRNERMTEEEARAVIALWQRRRVERGGLTTSPDVTDVAEGLDISVAEAQELLREVRAAGQPPRQFRKPRAAGRSLSAAPLHRGAYATAHTLVGLALTFAALGTVCACLYHTLCP